MTTMESAGVAVKEFLPIPDVVDPNKRETSTTLADEPLSLSHELAVADHDEKGHAQAVHGKEVEDLGWHERSSKIPNPLVGGLPNEDLWVLVRRFNKVESPSLVHHSLTERI